MLVVEGRDVAPIEVATTRRARGRGLLGRNGLDGALWLPGVRSVHTVGMRFAIDVAWIDRSGVVLRTATLARGRTTRWVVRSAGVLEAEAGTFGSWGLAPGAAVTIRPAEGASPSGPVGR